MSPYYFEFHSVWHIPADLITVWNHIGGVSSMPTWWPSIKEVRVLRGPELPVTIGTKAQYVVHAPLYALTYETEVIEVETGKRILARSQGDLSGTGCWTFKEGAGDIQVAFEWRVEITPPWLKVASRLPLARPIMRYFHNRVMQQGEAGLKQLIAQEVTPAAEVV